MKSCVINGSSIFLYQLALVAKVQESGREVFGICVSSIVVFIL